ncbi:MAG TPA: replicative DNA helicase [Gammaproteobacteria bacterium]|jgi:replicative DNA helicase|nr:replicative DNA helicase [Gammaproteobacteria bacterium]PHS09591.1 MAG: replicative DNA helicase [Acidithiobacillus sp.]HAD37862.1 replicative DNA helicase [Gammaproteobacteria bacterium]HBK76942.1 replicative DNA helicase [Gammaproteobacteria bacterium]HIA40823.1 replicative DNA helicase [Gammaproteobacteria bacterium]|tara:strand:+ start:1914 stop:3296 length:1383 start_codon:yes stop_codon:yes gene_type:complete
MSETQAIISNRREYPVPPQALEAEQSVLGCLLLDSRRWDDVAEVVLEEDFYTKAHRDIFSAIKALHAADEPVDVVTTAEWLGNSGVLDRVGGLTYLGELAKNTPGTVNVIAYAAIVRERSVLRRLINVATQISEKAYNPEGSNVEDLLGYAEKLVFDIAEADKRQKGGFMPIQGLLTEALDRIEELYESGQTITGVSTGFGDLDDITSGLQPSDLIVIAGRPSMGKTSLAMNIVENAAIGSKLPVAVFSMEMPGQQLAMRMLSSLGRINAHHVRTGKLSKDDWPRLTSAVELLDSAPIYIDDTPALTPVELRSRIRRLSRERGRLGMIVVDYLQLMQTGDNSENRAVEVSNITRALKIIAKEMSAPVVVLSQLNRSLEQRPNKRPVMSDLRESGAIEQDADVIFFIYRDEIYNEDSKDRGTAEIIIGKQRNGPTGTIRLTFLGEYTRFENYVSEFSEPLY